MTEKKTVFKAAKFKKYEKIISFTDPESARQSARDLKAEFDKAQQQAKKIRIFRVAQLSATRSRLTLRRKNLSVDERKEFKEITNIYQKLTDQLGMRLEMKSAKYAKMRYLQYVRYGR